MTYQPRTRFAGSINPFTKERIVSKTESELASLRIVDAMPEGRIQRPGAYTALFEQLKPGQAIECEMASTQKIRLALRKFMEHRGMLDDYYPKTREVKRTGKGYVGIFPRSELVGNPHSTRSRKK